MIQSSEYLELILVKERVTRFMSINFLFGCFIFGFFSHFVHID